MTDPHDTAPAPSPSESLPEGWTEIELGQLGDWGSGGTPTRTNPDFYAESGIPWLVIGDLNNAIIYGAKNHITESGLKSSSAKLLNPGTLLVAMYGSIGKLGITGVQCATNQAIAFCVPDTNLTSLKFLYYTVQNEQDALIAQGQGGAQQNISQTILKAHTIPLPPLPEQIRIADKLDALLSRVEAGRERLERVPGLLKRFRQSVLSAAVSGELTREWREMNQVSWETSSYRVGDMGAVITGGTPKKDVRGGQGDVPFFKPSELDNGYEVRTASELVTEAAASTVRPIPEKTVMVTCIGATIGKTGLSRTAGITNQQINSVVCNPHIVLPEYCFFLMISREGQAAIIDNASSTTLPILNKSRFSDLEFDLPSIPEQTEVVRRVEALFAIADRIEARYQSALTTFNRLTPALLAKAFRGELVPQDPNDEPASVLLERIRAARAAAGEKPKRGRGAAKSAGGAEGTEPKRRGRPPGAQAQDTGAATEPKRRGRPPKARPEDARTVQASSYEDAVRQLEAQKRMRAAGEEPTRAEGTRLVGLFEEA